VRAAHLDALAADELLQDERAARRDGEHAVEAEPRGRNSSCRFALRHRELRARGVALCGRAAVRELAVVVEPGSEDLDLGVVHHTLRADELLERSRDVVIERPRRPVLNPAADRLVEACLSHGPLVIGETAPLVLAAAAARARRIPRDRAAHTGATVAMPPDGPPSSEALIVCAWSSTSPSRTRRGRRSARASHRRLKWPTT
jgi:hypothetical protein